MIIIIIFLVFIFIPALKDSRQIRKSYISLTTIPSRLSNPWFENNLHRLLKIAGDSQVILNIPYKSLKGEEYYIPPSIKSLQGPNFLINRCEKDLGPITKLIPILELDNIPDNAIIMVCDDDIKYKKNSF